MSKWTDEKLEALADDYITMVDTNGTSPFNFPCIVVITEEKTWHCNFGFNSNSQRLINLHAVGTFLKETKALGYILIYEAWLLRVEKDSDEEKKPYGHIEANPDRQSCVMVVFKNLRTQTHKGETWRENKDGKLERMNMMDRKGYEDLGGDFTRMDKFYKPGLPLAMAKLLLRVSD